MMTSRQSAPQPLLSAEAASHWAVNTLGGKGVASSPARNGDLQGRQAGRVAAHRPLVACAKERALDYVPTSLPCLMLATSHPAGWPWGSQILDRCRMRRTSNLPEAQVTVRAK